LDQRYSWTEPYVYYDIDRCNSTDPPFQTDFCEQAERDCVDSWLAQATLAQLRRLARPAVGPWLVATGWHKPHPPWPIPRRFTARYPPPSQIPLARFRTLSPGAPPLASLDEGGRVISWCHFVSP
jgi:hypothetical protein